MKYWHCNNKSRNSVASDAFRATLEEKNAEVSMLKSENQHLKRDVAGLREDFLALQGKRGLGVITENSPPEEPAKGKARADPSTTAMYTPKDLSALHKAYKEALAGKEVALKEAQMLKDRMARMGASRIRLSARRQSSKKTTPRNLRTCFEEVEEIPDDDVADKTQGEERRLEREGTTAARDLEVAKLAAFRDIRLKELRQAKKSDMEEACAKEGITYVKLDQARGDIAEIRASRDYDAGLLQRHLLRDQRPIPVVRFGGPVEVGRSLLPSLTVMSSIRLGAMEGGGRDGGGKLTTAERTKVAATISAVHFRCQVERLSGRMKAQIRARRRKVMQCTAVEGVVQAEDLSCNCEVLINNPLNQFCNFTDVALSVTPGMTLPDSSDCECRRAFPHCSDLVDGHIVSVDYNIISDDSLRKLFQEGSKYRLNGETADVFQALAIGLDEYIANYKRLLVGHSRYASFSSLSQNLNNWRSAILAHCRSNASSLSNHLSNMQDGGSEARRTGFWVWAIGYWNAYLRSSRWSLSGGRRSSSSTSLSSRLQGRGSAPRSTGRNRSGIGGSGGAGQGVLTSSEPSTSFSLTTPATPQTTNPSRAAHMQRARSVRSDGMLLRWQQDDDDDEGENEEEEEDDDDEEYYDDEDHESDFIRRTLPPLVWNPEPLEHELVDELRVRTMPTQPRFEQDWAYRPGPQTKHKHVNTAYLLSQRELNSRGLSPGARRHIGQRLIPGGIATEVDRIRNDKGYIGQFSKDGEVFIAGYQVYSTLSRTVHIVNVESELNGSCAVSNSSKDDIHMPLYFGMDHRRDNFFALWSLEFSHDGREIIAGSGNGNCSLHIYDLTAHKATLSVNAHSDDVNSVTFADESSKVLFSGGDDGLCKVWDRRCLSSKSRPQGVLVGHTEGLTFVNSKGDGRYLISNSKDQTLKLWDIRKMVPYDNYRRLPAARLPQFRWDYRWVEYPGKNKEISHPHDCSIMTYRGHTVLRTLIRCYFSPMFLTGQRYIYTGSQDGAIYVYDVITGKVAKTLRGHTAEVRDCSWHPTQPLLASVSWDGTLLRWDNIDANCDDDYGVMSRRRHGIYLPYWLEG
ncbi:hypothetical protein CBR_g29307 [Chara braunii]|uniref:Uncharacterized protein n=1 Tax=Chara braunii TaxID=69332 RepID=A0A388LAE4_CHABU|nr:hypothetical protein CBR_g29307 [Chara braunii]|eukprot:GBG79256.1 hypothetical protein CBR_g29307 [Chara braunii]